jgi:hypothetical protein
MAIQTIGRPFRRFDGKTTIRIYYYIRRFAVPKKGMTKRELLSDRTNALLLLMQLDEMNHPILVPIIPNSVKDENDSENEPKRLTLIEIFGDQYQAMKKELFEEIIKNSASMTEVGEKLGNLTYKSIGLWMKYHGIPESALLPLKGEYSPVWKGGCWTDSHGYKHLHCAHINYSAINPSWRSRDVLQHKYVIEKEVLGSRPVPAGYCIHHIDRDRGNNELANLSILTYAQHQKIHALLRHEVAPERINGILFSWHSGNVTNIFANFAYSELTAEQFPV